MSTTALELLEAALRLPENERAELAAHLLESFAPVPDDEESAQMAAELARRIAELENGSVQPIPWEEVRSRLREGL
ncbi:MAG TPA: addiction module protein [Pirellulaceae bacterium]|nr:addiction module protein [Pirellulaceae bacterium]